MDSNDARHAPEHRASLAAEWVTFVAQAYDACAPAYLAGKQATDCAEYLQMLLARLPAPATIADLGCGAGYPVAQTLAAAGHQVLGVDISRAQLALARQTVPTARFAQMDLGALGLVAGSVQAVVMFYALFHLPREQHARILADIWRALAPGGWLLVTLGAEPWEGQELFCGVPMRWSHWGSDTYLALLGEQGFEVTYQRLDTSHDERHFVVLAHKSAGAAL